MTGLMKFSTDLYHIAADDLNYSLWLELGSVLKMASMVYLRGIYNTHSPAGALEALNLISHSISTFFYWTIHEACGFLYGLVMYISVGIGCIKLGKQMDRNMANAFKTYQAPNIEPVENGLGTSDKGNASSSPKPRKKTMTSVYLKKIKTDPDGKSRRDAYFLSFVLVKGIWEDIPQIVIQDVTDLIKLLLLRLLSLQLYLKSLNLKLSTKRCIWIMTI